MIAFHRCFDPALKLTKRVYYSDVDTPCCPCRQVWTPPPRSGVNASDGSAASPLPVIVFVHGGGFMIGAGSIRWYAGGAYRFA